MSGPTTPDAAGGAGRMTEHEALMWNVEKDPWLNPSGGALFVLDRPIDVERLRRRMRVAAAGLPRLHQRVQPGLGRLSTPVWVPDPEFDFDHHFRVIGLGGGHRERDLLDLAARLYCEPLDRTRPLWRMVVIEGLEDGKGALWSLIHHSIADGIGQLRMAELFQDLEREPALDDEIDLEAVVAAAVAAHRDRAGRDPATGLGNTAVHTAGHLARRGLGMARRAVGEVAIWPADPTRIADRAGDAAALVHGTLGPLLAGGPAEGGATLWRERSRHRRLETVRVPLDELKDAGRAHGATINETFVAVMVQAAVRYHADRGETLDSLTVSFVMSTRHDDAMGGNAFTPVPVVVPAAPLPLGERMAAVREIVAAAREEAGRSGGITALSGIVNLLPTSVVTRTARSQARRIDLATSNLRGAPFPLYVGGAEVEYSVTMGPLAGTPCNATALSYRNSFDIGLFVDPVAIDDPAGWRDAVAAVFEELLHTD